MSLYGIGGYPARPATHAPLPPAGGRTAPVQPEGSRPASPALRPATTAPGEPAPAPLEMPAGADPALWSILSAEERGYFAKLGAMGPLTYGRVMDGTHQAPIARGGRLDVKV